MDDLKKLFGARIKELRENSGLNQEQLAELVEFDSRHLSRIETGKCFTTIDNIEKIAAALNVEASSLFEYKHEKSKELLIKDIDELLQKASPADVKLVYRIILAVLL